MSKPKITPTGKRVLLKLSEAKESKIGTIYIPEKYANQFGSVAKQPIRLGKVLALGQEVQKDYGDVVKVGGYVLIHPLNLGLVKVDGEEFALPEIGSCFAFVDEEDVPEDARV